MGIRTQSLLWAAGIIAAAWFSNANGMSANASFGIVAGLTGAAIGAIYGQRSKSKGCC